MRFQVRRSVRTRIVPFAVFMALLALRQALPADADAALDTRWLYPLQVGAADALPWLAEVLQQDARGHALERSASA